MNRIQILDMDFVLQSKTRQFHAHKIVDRSDPIPSRRAFRVGDSRHSFGVLRQYLLAGENHVYRASRLWFIRIDQHVDSRFVTEPETGRLNGPRNFLQSIPVDGNVDVPRKPRG
jgi:hypothetical protein